MEIITLDENNIEDEHICCGFSDKKIADGYNLKKELIRQRLAEGFRFKKFDIRGKVFIEYVPAENAWSPVDAPGYSFIHCFWVSGRYKGQGLGTRLLEECFKESKDKNGVVALTTKKTMPFTTDKGFFIKKGFEVCDTAPPYFELLVKRFKDAPSPQFRKSAKRCTVENKKGLTFVYSDMCTFTDYWVDKMIEFAREVGISSQKNKLANKEQARNAPSAFSVFSIFFNGEFLSHKIMGQKEFTKVLKARR